MIYLIRHAQSKYNKAESEIRHKYGQTYRKTDEYLDIKFSREFLDADLTEHGMMQCLQTRQKMKHIDVDLVIVSPLKRALKTCEIIFEGHKSNPIVIVNPTFREVLSSSQDIGNKIEQSKKQFPRFDFSLVNEPDYWYLTNIQDQQLKECVLSKLHGQKNQSKKQAAIEITLEFMRQNYSARVKEPHKEQELLKKFLPSLEQQRNILVNHLQKYRSIVVVSHSENIKAYAGHKIKNCEVYPINQQNLINLNTQ